MSPPRTWVALLADAVSKPGVISDAYRTFWNYSVGNQLLAMFQCYQRQIPVGPINTFLGWKDCGRFVRKGEKAITLCMPVTCKRVRPSNDPKQQEEDETFTRFVYRPNWFVLAQTDGAEYVPASLPEWTEEQALAALKIDRVEFEHPNGNTQGYARERQVSVSPIAFSPQRTLLHELAHVVLGHTTEFGPMEDDERTPMNLREVEAESVALICSESLGLNTAHFSRGYIQHWLRGESIPERSAQRIFRAADQILRAGQPVKREASNDD